MRVLIIGAGLGGLYPAPTACARSRHRRRASTNAAPRTGPQPASYGIHLNAHGTGALHGCLPAENWAAVDAAAVPAPDVVRFHDPHLAC